MTLCFFHYIISHFISLNGKPCLAMNTYQENMIRKTSLVVRMKHTTTLSAGSNGKELNDKFLKLPQPFSVL